MKGKGCQFHHPKRCTKLMIYGTKADKGCNEGKKCPDFHPKMCPSSITKGKCFDNRYNLCHVKGTKRKKPEVTKEVRVENHKVPRNVKEGLPETDVSNTAASPTPKSLQQTFLDQISLLKKEISEAVDSKISALLQQSMPQHRQDQQHLPLPMQMMSMQYPTQQQISPYHLQYPQMMQMWYPPYSNLMSPVPQVYQPQGNII